MTQIVGVKYLNIQLIAMFKKKLIQVFVFTLLSFAVNAQTKKVSGTVTSADNLPLQGVSVKLKGGKAATLTNATGQFTIDISEKLNTKTLVFASLGYSTYEIQITNQETLSINLKPSVSDLDEVVVVGYGTQRKRDLTGAVTKVDISDLQKAPVRSFEEALGGRVAGVTVTSSDGQPGSTNNIVIRGNNSITQDNSPLWVVDGVPIENPNNNAINPADIESIEVLKDASATAIYGARAANGVIMVTTKKGVLGKTKFSFASSYAEQDIIKKMQVLSPYEFVRYQSEYDPINTNAQYLTNGTTIDYYKAILGVNWQDAVLKTAPMRNNSLSMSGGTDATKYYVSLSALNQEGIIRFSGYDRYQGRFRLDQSVNSKLKIALNVNYSALKSYGTIPSSLENGSSQSSSLMSQVWGYRPVTNTQNYDLDSEDALFAGDPNDSRFNPYERIRYEVRNRFSNTIYTNLTVDYKITKDLTFKSTIGVTNDVNRNETFNGSKTPAGSPNTVGGRANGVNGSVLYQTTNSYVNENTFNYNKKFGKKNTIDAVAGFTAQGVNKYNYGVAAAKLPNESLGLAGLDEGIPSTVVSTKTRNTLASALARINYSYDGKYLASASFRADGSSKFSTDNKWSYFPSGSLAWRFSQEKFMDKFSFINDGKIRVSHGLVGNNRVSDFAYLTTMYSPITISYPFNNVLNSSTIPYTLGNPNLRWESTTQSDAGIDLSFFKSKMGLTIDVYRKVTKDLLLNADMPTSSGFATAYKNVGSVQNQGLEITLNAKIIEKPKFSWNSSFNIAFNENKILSLNDGQEALLSTISWDNTPWKSLPAYIAKVGQPIGQFYGYIWDGLYQIKDFNVTPSGSYVLKTNIASNTTTPNPKIQPGHIKYRDLNGDLIMNDNDKTVIGNATPKFTGGFTNNFKYNNFDLNLFLQYSYGGQLLNANRLAFEGNSGRTLQNQFASVLNRWTIDNQNNTMYVAKGDGDKVYSSRVIEDGSYLRLKTMQLGYTLPLKDAKRLNIQSFRIYISGQNLWTWTNYTGYDPEVSVYSSALTPGFDYSVYPRAKTMTIGINLNF
jgi:TonB-linked SusC/RagA family outer membrane protein